MPRCQDAKSLDRGFLPRHLAALPASSSASTRLPTSVAERKSNTAWPIGQKIPDPPPTILLLTFLRRLCPQGLMLGPPLRACLEKVLPRLSLAPALPALGGGSILHLLEVLPCEVMPCLDLVERQGKPLRTPSYRTVRPLALRSRNFYWRFGLQPTALPPPISSP